jgi:peptide/nickel transport system substrate-binding protein
VRRPASLLCCLFAVVLGATACRDTATLGDRLPADERIVVLVPEVIRGDLDPRLNTRAWPGKVIHLVYEGVTSVHNDTQTPEPALAERVDQPSRTIYDVHLRPEARFHDGSPVTAEDVRATYASIRDPALQSPFRGQFDRIASMEVRGPHHLRITLDAPHAPFLSDLSIGVVPAAALGPGGHAKGPLPGAGPYRLLDRTGSREVVLERFDAWWRGPARTRYVVVRTVSDQNTRLLALLGGAGDLVQNAVSPRMADAMRGHRDLAVDTAPGVAYSYLAFNLRDGPLADRRVRQAFAHAVNRERLIEHKFRGVARPATGMLPAGHWAYTADVPQHPYDPARARALLDAAGLPDPPGEAPRFTVTLKSSPDKFRRNLATLVAADLEAVGVRVEVQSLEVGTLLADVKSGNFETYILQWGDPSEPHFYNWIFHGDRIPTPSEPNRGGNRGAYVEPRVDALIDAGRVTTGTAERRRIYAELQQILARDLPYLSLWHENVLVVRRAGLKGYRLLPGASLFGLIHAYWE